MDSKTMDSGKQNSLLLQEEKRRKRDNLFHSIIPFKPMNIHCAVYITVQ